MAKIPQKATMTIQIKVPQKDSDKLKKIRDLVKEMERKMEHVKFMMKYSPLLRSDRKGQITLVKTKKRK